MEYKRLCPYIYGNFPSSHRNCTLVSPLKELNLIDLFDDDVIIVPTYGSAIFLSEHEWHLSRRNWVFAGDTYFVKYIDDELILVVEQDLDDEKEVNLFFRAEGGDLAAAERLLKHVSEIKIFGDVFISAAALFSPFSISTNYFVHMHEDSTGAFPNFDAMWKSHGLLNAVPPNILELIDNHFLKKRPLSYQACNHPVCEQSVFRNDVLEFTVSVVVQKPFLICKSSECISGDLLMDNEGAVLALVDKTQFSEENAFYYKLK